MRLTTKGRFAVTAMIDLALRSNAGPVALAAISQRQQISLSYLEQLFGKLRRHELVESTRGPGGGYSLGRAAAEITVADIIVAVDEPIDATGCAGKENCMGEDSRPVHDARPVGQPECQDDRVPRFHLAAEAWSTSNWPRACRSTWRPSSARSPPCPSSSRSRSRPPIRCSPSATPSRSERRAGLPARSSQHEQENPQMTPHFPIYMDYGATTPCDPRVVDAMIPWLREHFGNPASRSHAWGWEAEAAVEKSRAQVAAPDQRRPARDRLDQRCHRVDQPGLKGAAHFYSSRGKHLITLKTEHKATLDTMRELERQGFEVTYLDVQGKRPGRPGPLQGRAAQGHHPGVGAVRQQRDRRHPGRRRHRRDVPRARHHLPRRRAPRPPARSRSTCKRCRSTC